MKRGLVKPKGKKTNSEDAVKKRDSQAVQVALGGPEVEKGPRKRNKPIWFQRHYRRSKDGVKKKGRITKKMFKKLWGTSGEPWGGGVTRKVNWGERYRQRRIRSPKKKKSRKDRSATVRPGITKKIAQESGGASRGKRRGRTKSAGPPKDRTEGNKALITRRQRKRK